MSLHIAKAKAAGGEAYRYIEHVVRYRNEPGRDVQYHNTDIDKDKTKENYALLERNDPYGYLKQKVKEYDIDNPPKRKKKDRVIVTQFCFTVPAEISGTEKENDYFQHCFEWMKARFGENNIVCAEVHKDEIHDYYDSEKQKWTTSRAHLQAAVIPYVDEKGVYAKGFTSRQNLKQYQNDLDSYIYEKMGVHNLTGEFKKGKSTNQLKRESITAVDKMLNEKTEELVNLEAVYEAEVQNINASINDAERNAERKIADIKESAEQEIEDFKSLHNETMREYHQKSKERLKCAEENYLSKLDELKMQFEEEKTRTKNAYQKYIEDREIEAERLKIPSYTEMVEQTKKDVRELFSKLDKEIER